MMQNCTQNCAQWAQWKVTVPIRNDKNRIVRFKTVAILCGEHKKQMEAAEARAEKKQDLRFNFVGAVPDGNYNPEP